jgi:signal transduction histidine kinase
MTASRADSLPADFIAATATAPSIGATVSERQQEFLSMIVHDLKTPLATLKVNLHMMTADGFRSEDTIERVLRAQRSISRMINMIAQLLDFERIDSGMLAVQPVSTLLQTAIDSSIDLVVDLADEKNVVIRSQACNLSVFADEDRLVQIIVNLLSNAIKFSSGHGSVRLTVDDYPDSICINISDDGPGIPLSAQGKIFDRFVQLPIQSGSRVPGTGLGLPICKYLVERHGGIIGVDSEEGRGSRFWFTLPKEASIKLVTFAPNNSGEV